MPGADVGAMGYEYSICRCKLLRNKPTQMKTLPLVMILLSFSACSIVGKKTLVYGKCSKGYFACTQFELKKDNTFEYYIFMDVGGGNVIKGRWDVFNGDTLIMNTFTQPVNRKTYAVGKVVDTLSGTIKITMHDFEAPLYFSEVAINDGALKDTLDIDGIAYFNASEIRNISYNDPLWGRRELIHINNPHFNDIEVIVRDIDYSIIPTYIVDKLVVATGRYIIMNPSSSETPHRLKRAWFGKRNWK
jgi:hypothetical protein